MSDTNQDLRDSWAGEPEKLDYSLALHFLKLVYHKCTS